MMKSVALWATIIISAGSLFPACVSNAKVISSADYDLSKVPADFNPKKHILLVAEMPKRTNVWKRHEGATKKLDEALKAFYPYKYEIVSLRDILENQDKYSDTSVYKYAMRNNLSSTTHTTTTHYSNNVSKWDVSTSARTTWVDFYFFDRTTGAAYPESGNANPSIKYCTLTFAELIKRAKP